MQQKHQIVDDIAVEQRFYLQLIALIAKVVQQHNHIDQVIELRLWNFDSLLDALDPLPHDGAYLLHLLQILLADKRRLLELLQVHDFWVARSQQALDVHFVDFLKLNSFDARNLDFLYFRQFDLQDLRKHLTKSVQEPGRDAYLDGVIQRDELRNCTLDYAVNRCGIRDVFAQHFQMDVGRFGQERQQAGADFQFLVMCVLEQQGEVVMNQQLVCVQTVWC